MNTDTDTYAYAACGHGSDDVDSCFGCEFEEPIGPHPFIEPRKQRTIRYGARFVDQYRQLSGNQRFPLQPVQSLVRSEGFEPPTF